MPNTVAATGASRHTHWDRPNWVSDEFLALCGSFPRDYDYGGIDPQYLIGMSVPPVMMAGVAMAVYDQLLSVL